MLAKFIHWLERECPVLFAKEMPVWMTILVSVIAASITYVWVPSFNRQFEIEDVRSAHLTKATDQINDDMIELSQCLRQFNSAFVNKSDKVSIVREKCLDVLTKIQWRLVDVRVILNKGEDANYVTAYANALTNLKRKLDAPVNSEYLLNVATALASLTRSSQKVLDRLYLRASLKVE